MSDYAVASFVTKWKPDDVLVSCYVKIVSSDYYPFQNFVKKKRKNFTSRFFLGSQSNEGYGIFIHSDERDSRHAYSSTVRDLEVTKLSKHQLKFEKKYREGILLNEDNKSEVIIQFMRNEEFRLVNRICGAMKIAYGNLRRTIGFSNTNVRTFEAVKDLRCKDLESLSRLYHFNDDEEQLREHELEINRPRGSSKGKKKKSFLIPFSAGTLSGSDIDPPISFMKFYENDALGWETKQFEDFLKHVLIQDPKDREISSLWAYLQSNKLLHSICRFFQPEKPSVNAKKNVYEILTWIKKYEEEIRKNELEEKFMELDLDEMKVPPNIQPVLKNSFVRRILKNQIQTLKLNDGYFHINYAYCLQKQVAHYESRAKGRTPNLKIIEEKLLHPLRCHWDPEECRNNLFSILLFSKPLFSALKDIERQFYTFLQKSFPAKFCKDDNDGVLDFLIDSSSEDEGEDEDEDDEDRINNSIRREEEENKMLSKKQLEDKLSKLDKKKISRGQLRKLEECLKLFTEKYPQYNVRHLSMKIRVDLERLRRLKLQESEVFERRQERDRLVKETEEKIRIRQIRLDEKRIEREELELLLQKNNNNRDKEEEEEEVLSEISAKLESAASETSLIEEDVKSMAEQVDRMRNQIIVPMETQSIEPTFDEIKYDLFPHFIHGKERKEAIKTLVIYELDQKSRTHWTFKKTKISEITGEEMNDYVFDDLLILKTKLVISRKWGKGIKKIQKAGIKLGNTLFSELLQYGPYHASVMISNVNMNWYSNGFVYVKHLSDYENYDDIVALDANCPLVVSVGSLWREIQRIARELVFVNVNMNYSGLNFFSKYSNSLNCHEFSHRILRSLNHVNFSGIVKSYLDDLSSFKGSDDENIRFINLSNTSKKFRKKFKRIWESKDEQDILYNKKKNRIDFLTHAQLDTFYHRCLIMEYNFNITYPGVYQLLKGFDRAYWMSHLNRLEAGGGRLVAGYADPNILPRSAKEGGCPFGMETIPVIHEEKKNVIPPDEVNMDGLEII